MWSDSAKQMTRTCALSAGMGTRDGGDLHIISEPEAAAIYALTTMDRGYFEVGDTFVLCDGLCLPARGFLDRSD
jgi:hypothetical protein